MIALNELEWQEAHNEKHLAKKSTHEQFLHCLTKYCDKLSF